MRRLWEFICYAALLFLVIIVAPLLEGEED